MGACASKPKDLSDDQPAPLPRETPDSPKKAEGETVPEENNNGGEVRKEEPLVNLSEPAQEATKSEGTPFESKTVEAEAASEKSKPSESSEVTAKTEDTSSQEAPKTEGTFSESKTVEAEAVSREIKPSKSSEVTAKPTDDKVEPAEATVPAKEEKKVDDVAEKPKVDVVAPSSEDKSDAPLVTM